MDQNRTQLLDSTQNKNSRTVDKTVYRGFYNLKRPDGSRSLSMDKFVRQKLFEEWDWEKIFAFAVAGDSKFCIWDILTFTRYVLQYLFGAEFIILLLYLQFRSFMFPC